MLAPLPRRRAPGPDRKGGVPWLFLLMLGLAVAAGVIAWAAVRRPPPPPGSTGAEIFAYHCARCHGLDGGGASPASLAPPIRGLKRTRAEFDRILREGPVRSGRYGVAMPTFARLSEAEREALFRYLAGP